MGGARQRAWHQPGGRVIIFDNFRQGGDMLAGKPQGTGLSPHISRHMIERFGGSIWVDRRPGQGASFIFTLPFDPVSAAHAA